MDAISFITNLHSVYSERGLATGFLAEPFNAFSNLLYFLAAYLSYAYLKSTQCKTKQLYYLPILLTAVGIGSFSYHTSPNNITLFLDSIPIFIFIFSAVFLLFQKLIGDKTKSIISLICFIAVLVIATVLIPKEFLNGSIRHVINLAWFIALVIWVKRKFGGSLFKQALVPLSIYGVAIVFRSIDQASCLYIPIGTHFLWHLLAAIAGYFTIKLLANLHKLEWGG
jgi:hypothetical protein